PRRSWRSHSPSSPSTAGTASRWDCAHRSAATCGPNTPTADAAGLLHRELAVRPANVCTGTVRHVKGVIGRSRGAAVVFVDETHRGMVGGSRGRAGMLLEVQD